MDVRNENIGIVVSAVVMLAGCWIAGWDLSDDEGAVIFVASWVAGLATITGLYERERKMSRK